MAHPEKSNARQMHLGLFLNPAGNHQSGWRLPEVYTSAEDFPAILSIARTAERGKFDFVFFADGPSCSLEAPPGMMLRFEPTTLLGALSATTTHIGLVATVSTTFTEPYNLARAFASIDGLSGGRSGWNVVTSALDEQAANFGRELPPHDLRYEIADEYIQVVQGLWDGWESGARLENKATGQYIDKSKVHNLDHKGKYFTVQGPLGHSRSPQGRPVIVQAGSSEAGQSFAAKYAELIFTVQQDIEEAQKFYKGMKEKITAAGRAPDQCKILPGLLTIVGRTSEQAREKLALLTEYIEPGSAMKTMSQRLGHDMSQFPLDEPLPDLPPSTHGVQTFAKVMYTKAQREGLTLREVHDIFALSRGYMLVSGTPTTVADVMEEWFVSEASDGFMLTPAYFPGAFDDFIELVLPELRRRGLFRSDYTGVTLRNHLGLSEPNNRYSKS